MKTSRTAAILLGAVALGSIGFVGCGSSDTPATTAAATADGANAEPRMTTAEYVAAADKVCADAMTKQKEIAAPTDPVSTKGYLVDLALASQGAVDGLQGLYPPADLEAAHTALIDAQLNGVQFVTQVAADMGDTPTDADVTAATEKLTGAEVDALAAEERAAAEKLGLTACVEFASQDRDSAE